MISFSMFLFLVIVEYYVEFKKLVCILYIFGGSKTEA